MGKQAKFRGIAPCPVCGGMDLDWEKPYVLEDGRISLDMDCGGCGSTWSRIFESTLHDTDIYPKP